VCGPHARLDSSRDGGRGVGEVVEDVLSKETSTDYRSLKMFKKSGTGKIEAVGTLEPTKVPIEKNASEEVTRKKVADSIKWQPTGGVTKDEK
jgi:hypothetical protein